MLVRRVPYVVREPCFFCAVLCSNDLWVAGESYGGKYGPAFAHHIHTTGKRVSLVFEPFLSFGVFPCQRCNELAGCRGSVAVRCSRIVVCSCRRLASADWPHHRGWLVWLSALPAVISFLLLWSLSVVLSAVFRHTHNRPIAAHRMDRSDPASQLPAFAPMLYGMGIVDEAQTAIIDGLMKQSVSLSLSDSLFLSTRLDPVAVSLSSELCARRGARRAGLALCWCRAASTRPSRPGTSSGATTMTDSRGSRFYLFDLLSSFCCF